MRLVVLACALVAAALPCAPAQAKPRPPVAVLVFDEFPLATLLTPSGEIDHRRFPGFSRLARSSTWFPNATTTFDQTVRAVPSILDGNRTKADERPVYEDHRRSLFTVLARAGYGMNVFEEVTEICPAILCPRRPHYGAVTWNLRRARKERLERTLRGVSRRGPTLTFHHSLTPHGPWWYLPNGKRRTAYRPTGLLGEHHPYGFGDPTLREQGQQAQLLQVGFVDYEIRRLIRRLKARGRWRKALVVVTADHGYSFVQGPLRRAVSARNIHDIAPVPLFVKRPGQRRGRVSRRWVRIHDVYPTITHVLGLRSGRVDGRSVFARRYPRRSRVSVAGPFFRRTVRISTAAIRARIRREVRRRARLLGTGAWENAYDIGPLRSLHGTAVRDLPVTTSPLRYRLERPDSEHYRAPGRVFAQNEVAGEVLGGAGEERRNLVVAINGRIVASRRTIRFHKPEGEWFIATFPESRLRGRNRIAVYEAREGRLERIYAR